MMTNLLKIRDIALKVYRRTGFVLIPVVRLILAYAVFGGINTFIGYDTRFTGTGIRFLLSAVCALLPSAVTVLIAMLLTLVHLFKASMFLSLLVLVAYIILYGLLIRFAPKYAVAVLLIPLLGRYGLHYAVPLVLGCIASPIAILPTICGAFVYGMADAIKAASMREVGMNLDEILMLCKDLMDVIPANKGMLAMIAVFAVVILAVFLIRRLPFSYSLYISVGVGAVLNALGFMIANLAFGIPVNISLLIVMSIMAGLVTVGFEMVRRVLDYNHTQYLSFEDEDYYYYVKAIPKLHLDADRREALSIADSQVRSAERSPERDNVQDDVADDPDESREKPAVETAAGRIRDMVSNDMFTIRTPKKEQTLPEDFEGEYDESDLEDND